MLARLMERLNDRRDAVREGEEAADAGFTLIELMVVLLILAILLAIAIPTFLGVTGSANNRAAQSNLNTALTSAKGIYEHEGQVYPTTTATGSSLLGLLSSDEPSLPLVAAPATSTTPITQGDVSLYVSANGNGVILYSLAKKTQDCWWVADNTQTIANGGTATVPVAPYIAASTGGTAVSGVPNAAGEWYGVFKTSATGAPACNAANFAASPSDVTATNFPASPA